jgi:hypothetical protein
MTPPRSPTLIRLKSWAIMVNDRLFPAVLRVRRSIAGCPSLQFAPSVARIGARGGAHLASVPLAGANVDVNLFTFSIAGVVLASICKVVRTLR